MWNTKRNVQCTKKNNKTTITTTKNRGEEALAKINKEKKILT